MLSGTVDLRLLNQPELHRKHGAFRLRNEVDVLDASFIEGNRPVRIVVADRSGDVESVRQLYVDRHIRICIKLGGEVALVRRIVDNVVVQVLLCLHGVRAELALDGRLGEDVRTVVVVHHAVGDVLDDYRSFLVVNQLRRLEDKLLRIVFELVERSLMNADEDLNDSLSGKPGGFNDSSNKVICDALAGDYA